MLDLEAFTPDCSRCAGLCCTALPFTASVDFPESKPAGTPCVNLQPDFTCVIHAELRPRGWRGCTTFECFGAGQHLTQHTFGGVTWRDNPAMATAMFGAFESMRLIQEVRYYLRVLVEHPLPRKLLDQVTALDATAENLAEASAGTMAGQPVESLRTQAGLLLGRASQHLRRQAPAPGTIPSRVRARADLAGADLRGATLDHGDLRGAVLIGADLRHATLDLTDLLGADLRDTRLHGADVRDALFVTQTQLNAAQGDAFTTIPPHLRRPHHWEGD